MKYFHKWQSFYNSFHSINRCFCYYVDLSTPEWGILLHKKNYKQSKINKILNQTHLSEEGMRMDWLKRCKNTTKITKQNQLKKVNLKKNKIKKNIFWVLFMFYKSLPGEWLHNNGLKTLTSCKLFFSAQDQNSVD